MFNVTCLFQIFAFLLQFLSKRRGVASSGVLFVFWFLEAFFGAFRFQTAIRHLSNTQVRTPRG